MARAVKSVVQAAGIKAEQRSVSGAFNKNKRRSTPPLFYSARAPETFTISPRRPVSSRILGELLRSAGDRDDAELPKLRLRVWIARRLDDLVVELVDDGARRAGRRRNPEPGAQLVARESRPAANADAVNPTPIKSMLS